MSDIRLILINGVFLVALIHLPQFGVCSWTWTCNSTTGLCGRRQSLNPESDLTGAYVNQELCRLTCGDEGIVWPKPTFSQFSDKSLVNVDLEKISFNIGSTDENVKKYLTDVINYFKNITKVSNKQISCMDDNLHEISVNLKAEETDTELTWETDEQYKLAIQTDDSAQKMTVTIEGQTVFGVRHGMETLLQLIVKNEVSAGEEDGSSICYATITKRKITDIPVYKHRGLLLDTGRNYLSVEIIRKNIVAMGMSKMNVLHWHLTDSQSFPFVSTRVANFTKYGAYSEKETYSAQDIKSLVKFAKIHGVRIIPEIDSPSHAGNGWQWGDESGHGNMVTCHEWQPWRSFCIQPPCGQMNPVNQKLYEFLGLLYADILDIWPNMEAFHMGGDEVFFPCWNSTPEIIDYLGPDKRSESDFLDLWGVFQSKAVQSFDSYATRRNTSIILWTSTLTSAEIVEKYLVPSRYVIQSWEPSSSNLPDQLLNLGYNMIISTKDKWYLDHGFWGTTAYYNWRDVYENRISTHEGVLGGEVCSWGELVDNGEAESRVWPRAAAAAERLWSNPGSNVTADMVEQRFFLHRERLVSRGIRAAAVTPKYCVQDEGSCNHYLE